MSAALLRAGSAVAAPTRPKAKKSASNALRQNRDFVSGGAVGRIDAITGAPMPVLFVDGWFASSADPEMTLLLQDGTSVRPQVARVFREDLAELDGVGHFAGFKARFLLKDEKPTFLEIGGKQIKIPRSRSYGTFDPHYGQLLDTRTVLHRDDIYGQGPPTQSTPQILELCTGLSGDVLDFGCGNGDLVVWLREQRNVEARGIELDTDRIRRDILGGARDHMSLYDGGTPLPFATASFDMIIATEVIEHLPRFDSYIPEFVRILRPGGKLYVTVPDMSSIPLSSITGTVPWHLLEATHLNFFTHASLANALAPFKLEMSFDLYPFSVSGRIIPGSLGAVFRAPGRP